MLVCKCLTRVSFQWRSFAWAVGKKMQFIVYLSLCNRRFRVILHSSNCWLLTYLHHGCCFFCAIFPSNTAAPFNATWCNLAENLTEELPRRSFFSPHFGNFRHFGGSRSFVASLHIPVQVVGDVTDCCFWTFLHSSRNTSDISCWCFARLTRSRSGFYYTSRMVSFFSKSFQTIKQTKSNA